MVRRHNDTVQPITNDGAAFDLSWITYPDWMRRALCAQVDPEIFFPDKGGSTQEAKKVCARCPVAAECLDYALADERTSYVSPTHFGIWGGTSERERRRIKYQLTQGETA